MAFRGDGKCVAILCRSLKREPQSLDLQIGPFVNDFIRTHIPDSPGLLHCVLLQLVAGASLEVAQRPEVLVGNEAHLVAIRFNCCVVRHLDSKASSASIGRCANRKIRAHVEQVLTTTAQRVKALTMDIVDRTTKAQRQLIQLVSCWTESLRPEAGETAHCPGPDIGKRDRRARCVQHEVDLAVVIVIEIDGQLSCRALFDEGGA